MCACEIECLHGEYLVLLRYDSTDVCLAWVLLKSGVYMVNGSVTMCFCLVDAAATAAKLKTLLETLRAPTSERARVNGDSNVLACYDLRKGCSLPARGPD